MPRIRKTWRQKLAEAKAKPGLPKEFFCEKSRQKFVAPSPAEVESIIRTVKRGRLITIGEMGRRLREAHKMDCGLHTRSARCNQEWES